MVNRTMQVGERLRHARVRAGLRQEDLARAAGVSTTALNRLESGAGSSLQTLMCVCEVLGIDLLAALPSSEDSRRRSGRLPGSALESDRSEVRRAYELHREVVRHLRTDPDRVLRIAKHNLEKMRTRPRNPLAEEWLEQWADALQAGPEAIEQVALRTDERGDDLRQVSPFAGVLSIHERRRALERAA